MDVPLTRFLAHFSPEIEADLDVESAPSIDQNEQMDPLEIVRAEARREAEAVRAVQVTKLKEEHETTLAEQLAMSRASWCEEEGARLATSLERALAEFESRLADQIASALRPLLRPAIVSRAVEAFVDALDAARFNPRHANLKVRGPADLLDAISAARPGLGHIELIRDKSPDVIVEGDEIYIATKLDAAFALLAQEI